MHPETSSDYLNNVTKDMVMSISILSVGRYGTIITQLTIIDHTKDVFGKCHKRLIKVFIKSKEF